MPTLSSRSRPSATPARQRQTDQIAELPQYQPPIAPLNERAQQALQALLRTHPPRRVTEHLEKASKHVTESAGTANEEVTNRRLEYESKKAKQEAKGLEPDHDMLAELEELAGRIDGLTRRLDKSMREIVDNQAFAQDLPEIMKTITAKANDLSTQNTAATFTQTQRATRRQRVLDDDEADSDGDQEMEDVKSGSHLAANDAASSLFQSSLALQSRDWNSKSLTARYSTANDYVGFYRTVHETKFADGNAPPLPRANTWFADEEETTGSVVEQDDEDIAIESERISVRCPITLLPFQDPVTSTCCPHSFERSAIMPMMKLPRNQSQSQPRVKETPCPICGKRLTVADLRSDPALLAKTKRVLAAEARAQQEGSDDDEDDDAPRGTQRRAELLGSSPFTASKNIAKSVKQERRSALSRGNSIVPSASRLEEVDVIPSTQMTSGGAVMVDLGDDEEEDHDDDDDDDDDDMEA